MNETRGHEGGEQRRTGSLKGDCRIPTSASKGAGNQLYRVTTPPGEATPASPCPLPGEARSAVIVPGRGGAPSLSGREGCLETPIGIPAQAFLSWVTIRLSRSV